jgi:hypothetical protein
MSGKLVATKCPRDGAELWGRQYEHGCAEAFDEISEWFCPNEETCGYRVGRFSGKVLKPSERERRP